VCNLLDPKFGLCCGLWCWAQKLLHSASVTGTTKEGGVVALSGARKLSGGTVVLVRALCRYSYGDWNGVHVGCTCSWCGLLGGCRRGLLYRCGSRCCLLYWCSGRCCLLYWCSGRCCLLYWCGGRCCLLYWCGGRCCLLYWCSWCSAKSFLCQLSVQAAVLCWVVACTIAGTESHWTIVGCLACACRCWVSSHCRWRGGDGR